MKVNPFLAISLVLASVKNFFGASRHDPSYDVSNKLSNGRDSFLGISAPRCHNQKKTYRGFAK